jgi:putative transcriptional regulator
MNRSEVENASAIEEALREAGFKVSQKCCSRPSCFDFAAKKDKIAILAKLHSDIDTFCMSDAHELKAIAEHISATSLLIGMKTREKPLEDDAVYFRYAVSVVTSKTFENIVVRGAFPLIHAGPGGYYVEVDGEAIKKRRQELGYSIGKVAEMAGISRRTLYGYERGMAGASVNSAYNLAKALGLPVAKPINIFGELGRRRHFLVKAKKAISGNTLLLRIFRKFIACDITPVKKAPFDFVLNIPEEKAVIVGGVTIGKEPKLDKRVDEILSVSEVVGAHPILITDRRNPPNKYIPCISEEALSEIRNPEDLIVNTK